MALTSIFGSTPTPPRNPFERIKARWLFAGAIFSLILSAIIVVVIWSPTQDLKPDSVQITALGFLWFVLMLFFLTGLGVHVNLDWPKLLGRQPSPRILTRYVPLTIPLIAISFTTYYLVYCPMSWVAPGWVESVLQSEADLAMQFTGGQGSLRLTSMVMNGITLVFLGPVTEELLFRGYLLHRWSLKWGLRRGVVLSCALFALGHRDILGAFVFALFLSFIYVETRSLLLAAAIHSAGNTIGFMLFLLATAIGGPAGPPTINEFRATWWLAALGLVVGVPWLVHFFRQRRNLLSTSLPYNC